jgi:hypothetical protein
MAETKYLIVVHIPATVSSHDGDPATSHIQPTKTNGRCVPDILIAKNESYPTPGETAVTETADEIANQMPSEAHATKL